MPVVPANSTRRALTRQWELLKLLPTRGNGQTAQELTILLRDAGHDATKRTVERDLHELQHLFPLLCNDKGMPYGWSWQPGVSSHLPGITLGEALTLRLVEDGIRPLIPHSMLKSLEPRFDQARQKLKVLAEENPAARWINNVVSVPPEFHLQPPNVRTECLDAIQQALMDSKQLSCRYSAAFKGKTHDFTLNPHALIQRGQVTYLLATAEPFGDIRRYVLHRFIQAQVLETACRKVEGFTLDGYLSDGNAQFGGMEMLSLRAWVNEGLCQLLRERPLSDDMELAPEEGGATLTATVQNSWELLWWLLSHAGSIQVQEPPSLRENYIRRLKAGLEIQEF
jgi:predicted DNA-binding transcriptional regulator YafY